MPCFLVTSILPGKKKNVYLSTLDESYRVTGVVLGIYGALSEDTEVLPGVSGALFEVTGVFGALSGITGV